MSAAIAVAALALGLVACGDGGEWKHPAPPYCPAVPSNLCPDKEVRP